MLNKDDIKLFSLSNESGAEVVLSNLGAAIISVVVPDSEGKMADVALGYSNLSDYLGDGPYMGKVPGRYANRIARGLFSIGGKEYKLSINNGPNHLHGGIDEESFSNRLWNAEEMNGGVLFSLDSPDGDAGYPGALHVEVFYSWGQDNALSIDIKATSDADTVVNLTNHAYFNLKGEAEGDVTGHLLKLAASHYLETDENLIPTGFIAPVAGTPMDFTSAKTLGSGINADFPAIKYGKGYDNCFVLDNFDVNVVREVAELTEPQSGRKLVVSTNAPGIQVYTGNWLEGCPVSKSEKQYHDYDGVALECQWLPDSPNHSEFPSTLLKKGETFENRIVFAFK